MAVVLSACASSPANSSGDVKTGESGQPVRVGGYGDVVGTVKSR